MEKKEIEDLLYKVNDTLRSIERLTLKCNENATRLNNMLLEMKGLAGMIRPKVKKTGWYGEELQAQVDEMKGLLNIEFKETNC